MIGGPRQIERSRRRLPAGAASVAALALVAGIVSGPARAQPEQPSRQAQKPAGAERKATEKKAAAEKKAGKEKAAAEKKAGQSKAAAEEKAAAKRPSKRVVGPEIDARAWILVDARDGEVLASGAPDRPQPIASATKLMTADLALRDLPPKKVLAAPAYDAVAAESILGLAPGEKMTVRDLLYALLLPSANDAAETLAIGAAGSERRFVREMNREARSLGLDDTHFANPVGLDDPDNYSTARDLATLAGALLEQRLFARIVDSSSALLKSGAEPRRIESRNTLLAREPWITGVKTGHTLGAGYVLVASANVDGASLISAVLGARSEAARDSQTLKLMRYGASLYKPKAKGQRGEEFARPKVAYSDDTLSLVAAKPFEVAARTGQVVKTEVEAPEEVSGPVRKGQPLGKLVVTVDRRPAAKVPLIAARKLPEKTLVDKAAYTLRKPYFLVPLALIVILLVVLLARRGRRAWQARRAEREQARIRTPDDRRMMAEERMRRRRERASGRGGEEG